MALTLLRVLLQFLVLTGARAVMSNAPSNKPNATFKDFIEKYQPSTVWQQIDKRRALNGTNFTRTEEFKIFFNGIDPTDELLSLPVTNGDARILLEKSGRRFNPGSLDPANTYDHWGLRRRLFELMKQAVYQARNKMIIMQNLRAERRKNALYKMGFLFAKTDLMARTFASVATKSFRACSMKQQTKYGAFYNIFGRPYHSLSFIDLVYTQERLMQLWFDIDLMVDVLDRNDFIGRGVLKKYTGRDRVKAFNKLFED